MPEENMNQEFRFKKTDEIRNHLIEEIHQNELMSKNHKEVCRVLNYVDVPLIVIFRITGCVSISAFASLVGIPIGIAGSTVGLKVCVITMAIKKYKLIIKGTLLCLRQFFATESPLDIMKSTFYFTSKALFILKIFKFWSWYFNQWKFGQLTEYNMKKKFLEKSYTECGGETRPRLRKKFSEK